MSELIQVGTTDVINLPLKSIGIIFHDKLKKWNPMKTLLTDTVSGEVVNYGTFSKLLKILAHELQNIGIKQGDVLTIISQNHWKYLLTLIAGFYVGAKVNLLNHDYTSGELKHIMSTCRPKVVFCTHKSLQALLELKNEDYFAPKIYIYDAPTSDYAVNFENLIESTNDSENFCPVEANPNDVSLILTSSGTTGFPKCVQLTNSNIRYTMTFMADPDLIDFNENESTIAFLPFFHIFGFAVGVGCVLLGVEFVILEKFVPDLFLKTIQNYKITKLFGVPPVFHFLIKSPKVQEYDISSMRDVLCGASFLSKEIEELVVKKLNVVSVRQGYGMTEASGAITLIPKNAKKYGSLGKPTTGVLIKVCHTETGEVLPANSVGEIRFKSDGVMKGYLGSDKETKQAFDGEGFMKTGDLGYYDDEGFFYIVGRLKEIIKYKGFQVSPAELENILLQHSAVKDVGVVGKPDERAGEVPVALVVKQADVTEEELVRHVEKNVSAQKRLYGGVKFVKEIPKNSSGKVLRMKLKELL
ncbi:uncharacterized protein LOC655211 [Tribolium castaneum]|nr:PREDICTED: 4-coumarate--CoA ligase 1 [Tribolium castaneum]|eukprot:XP_966820.2 PREDICTED: 4-coumarate--CoA ligase 1 [Tribolium castaneum]